MEQTGRERGEKILKMQRKLAGKTYRTNNIKKRMECDKKTISVVNVSRDQRKMGSKLAAKAEMNFEKTTNNN